MSKTRPLQDLPEFNVIAERHNRIGLALQQATQDAELYGTGWIRITEDGELHRVDPLNITIMVKPE